MGLCRVGPCSLLYEDTFTYKTKNVQKKRKLNNLINIWKSRKLNIKNQTSSSWFFDEDEDFCLRFNSFISLHILNLKIVTNVTWMIETGSYSSHHKHMNTKGGYWVQYTAYPNTVYSIFTTRAGILCDLFSHKLQFTDESENFLGVVKHI